MSDIKEVLRAVYERRAGEKLDMVEAIRMIFADRGYHALFDYAELRKYLWDLSPHEETERRRFALIYESGAIEEIRAATLDAYNYKEHFEAAEKLLMGAGLEPDIAHQTVYIFYEALGFPMHKKWRDPQRISEDGGNNGWIYEGEVRDGKPHGRGHEELIYDGEIYDRRDGLWINGQVYGYLYSEEELGVTEHCFCIDGLAIGKVTHIWPNGEVDIDEYPVPEGK